MSGVGDDRNGMLAPLSDTEFREAERAMPAAKGEGPERSSPLRSTRLSPIGCGYVRRRRRAIRS